MLAGLQPLLVYTQRATTIIDLQVNFTYFCLVRYPVLYMYTLHTPSTHHTHTTHTPQMTQVIVLVPTSPAINMSLRGEISYTDSVGTRRRVFFNASLYVTDMIRWVIKIDAFIIMTITVFCTYGDGPEMGPIYIFNSYNFDCSCITLYIFTIVFCSSPFIF